MYSKSKENSQIHICVWLFFLVSDQHQHNPKKYDLKEDQIAVSLGLGSDQYLNNNKLEEKIVLNTFVPLSDVKHSAPPGWVSKSNSTTLPPTGKAETVKLRTLYNSSSSGTSGGQTSEIRPRPRSTNLSPYRNQQSNSSRIGNAITNNVPGKVIRHSSRCGSLSPSSVSPTRLKNKQIFKRVTANAWRALSNCCVVVLCL